MKGGPALVSNLRAEQSRTIESSRNRIPVDGCSHRMAPSGPLPGWVHQLYFLKRTDPRVHSMAAGIAVVLRSCGSDRLY
ncbi:MAG: hypothetical protein D6753_18255 [Planctomycetota bacterium]|nr:MAG: hypothetical protein D6753_18255 [Planctomycetota bacterium]